MTLQTNRFIAELVLCWRRTFVALDTHSFRAGGDEHLSAGDKHFSAGDEHVETRVQISVTHTHSQVPATFKQNLYRAHLRKCALLSWGDPKLCICTTASFQGQIYIIVDYKC